MSIPESQLDTWSHQGSVTQSASTYGTIRNTLDASGTPYTGRRYEIFLQGSYGNDTNAWAESDVDIVIKLDDGWISDLSELTESQKNAYSNAHVDATYGCSEFKRDVTQVLTDKYGSAVKSGDKAIAIAAGGGRRKADVIVAIQFRRYHKFNGTYDQNYDEGICFWNAAGERIVNYPRQHSSNLTSRHQASNGWLKPVVRIFKNLRNRCVDDGLLAAGRAPSYYIEGLLYNVPVTELGGSYAESVCRSLKWIRTQADKSKLVCANEQYYLIRDGFHTCWRSADAEAFLAAAIRLWNEW